MPTLQADCGRQNLAKNIAQVVFRLSFASAEMTGMKPQAPAPTPCFPLLWGEDIIWKALRETGPKFGAASHGGNRIYQH